MPAGTKSAGNSRYKQPGHGSYGQQRWNWRNRGAFEARRIIRILCCVRGARASSGHVGAFVSRRTACAANWAAEGGAFGPETRGTLYLCWCWYLAPVGWSFPESLGCEYLRESLMGECKARSFERSFVWIVRFRFGGVKIMETRVKLKMEYK